MATLPENRAISPVVGIVLLLGIVVVLGSFTFGAVAFGVNDVLTDQTQAQLSAEPTSTDGSGSAITIVHEGGSTLETEDITVRATDADIEKPLSDFLERDTLEAGDRLLLSAEEIQSAEDGDTIVVRWQQQGQSLRMASTEIGEPASTSTPTSTATSTPTPTATSTPTPTATPRPDCSGDDHDRGHGNDCDRQDEDNPGNGPGGPGNGPH